MPVKLNHILFLLSIFSFLLSGCTSSSKQAESDSAQQDSTMVAEKHPSLILEGNTIRTRFAVPEDFERVAAAPGSFEEFLQNLALKPIASPIEQYNRQPTKDSLYWAMSIVDMDSIGFQNSHASIIRLRAEYLYRTKQFDKISFIIKNNIPFDFKRWLQGYRVEAKGKSINIKKLENETDMSYENFRAYLRDVFQYTDAKSFRKNLRLIKDDDDDNEFGIGTIIMSSRAPYDAVIVVDMIEMTANHSHPFGDTPAVLFAYGDPFAKEIAIISGYDWLGLFPKNRGEDWKEDAGVIWSGGSKGDREIYKQGGNIDIWTNNFIKKNLLKFYD